MGPSVVGAVPGIAGLDGRLTVVCGDPTPVLGQPAVDVRFALPLRINWLARPQPTPPPGVVRWK